MPKYVVGLSAQTRVSDPDGKMLASRELRWVAPTECGCGDNQILSLETDGSWQVCLMPSIGPVATNG